MKSYDYASAGAYFVTIVTQDRLCLFGDIVNGEMRRNVAGGIVQTTWNELPNHYPGVDIDASVVMPNHVHGIIVLADGSERAARPTGQSQREMGQPQREMGQPQGKMGQPQGVAPTMTLPDVVHRFKTLTTKRYTDGVKQQGWRRYSGRIWQRNYFEHIIRDEASLGRLREYIAGNPGRWAEDHENPTRSNHRGLPLR